MNPFNLLEIHLIEKQLLEQILYYKNYMEDMRTGFIKWDYEKYFEAYNNILDLKYELKEFKKEINIRGVKK
jgi:hypothetical protein